MLMRMILTSGDNPTKNPLPEVSVGKERRAKGSKSWGGGSGVK